MNDKIKNKVLSLNGYTIISFDAKYDIPTSMMKKGSKKAQAALLEQGIDRSKMYRLVTTTAHLSTTKSGYEKFVQNEFKRCGVLGDFEEWNAGQKEKYGETFKGAYEKTDQNNNALETKVNQKTGEIVDYLVIFRAKNTSEKFFYIDENTGKHHEFKLTDDKFVDFVPSKGEKYANFTEYEKLLREFRDKIAIRKPKLENILELRIVGDTLIKEETLVEENTLVERNSDKLLQIIDKKINSGSIMNVEGY